MPPRNAARREIVEVPPLDLNLAATRITADHGEAAPKAPDAGLSSAHAKDAADEGKHEGTT